MKAAQLTAYGGPENFRIADVPTPRPKPHEVLIQVAFAGLRWSDILGRRGTSARALIDGPFVPGAEASGIVTECGAKVTAFKPGDRVVALPANGAYAEYLAVPQDRVTRLPENASLEAALVYHVNIIPAWLMIYEWAKVCEGETVLIHAAAGGVGMVATQILQRRFENVRVIGLGSSPEKARAILANGADHAIDYRAEDYVEAVSRITGKKPPFQPRAPRVGVDVVFNGVAGETLEKDRAVLAKRGRWVLFGTPAGVKRVDLFTTIYESFTILPFSMMTFMGEPEMERAEAFREHWLANEQLSQPVIHKLDDIAAVHAAMEQGQTIGKQVFAIT